jgi:hypothetical protein
MFDWCHLSDHNHTGRHSRQLRDAALAAARLRSLLGGSGHGLLQRICLLVTQSGHRLADKLVQAEPKNQEAKELLADIFEQLG